MGGMSFYRDRNGAEADLIIEYPRNIALVEAKSANTASSSLFDSIGRVQKHLTRLPLPNSVFVAYGGNEHQRRARGSLVPWRDLHESAFQINRSEGESAKTRRY